MKQQINYVGNNSKNLVLTVEGSLKRLVDELRAYHDLAIAPYWPRIQEHLEGDTLKRGQALALGGVLGGAILVETVFDYPGLGRLMGEAVEYRD